MTNIREWVVELVLRLLTGLKLVAATIVGRVLATFGLSIVSAQALLPQIKQFVMQQVSGLPSQVVEFFGAVGGDIAMSMVLSALTVRLAWKTFIVPTTVAEQVGQ